MLNERVTENALFRQTPVRRFGIASRPERGCFMNDVPIKTRNFLPVLIGSAALIVCVLIASQAIASRRTNGPVITVFGLGTRDFVSDLIVWEGSFSCRDSQLKTAYARLDHDKDAVKSYLLGHGVKENEIVFSAVTLAKEFEQLNGAAGTEKTRFSGYRLTQGVSVESGEVDKIEAVSRTVTELINAGVELASQNPRYFYTKLAGLKLEMIGMAAEDGRRRAEAIAVKSNSRLGTLKAATTDVFQITARNSSDSYTYGGAFDTTSKVKTATITIKIQYSVK